MALILGLVSTFVEPVIKLLSLPFIILTLGFLLLVINAADAAAHRAGWPASSTSASTSTASGPRSLGSIIITIVGWGVRVAIRVDRG